MKTKKEVLVSLIQREDVYISFTHSYYYLIVGGAKEHNIKILEVGEDVLKAEVKAGIEYLSIDHFLSVTFM